MCRKKLTLDLVAR